MRDADVANDTDVEEWQLRATPQRQCKSPKRRTEEDKNERGWLNVCGALLFAVVLFWSVGYCMDQSVLKTD